VPVSERPAIRNESIEMVPIDSLTVHPSNPRRGDLGAIGVSLGTFGFYGTIVAQRSTGHVLAGNHRLMAARQAGMTEVPVAWVEIDDEESLRLLIADNRSSDLATNDDNQLAELLSALAESERGLTGTLYDGDDLDSLLASLEAPMFAPVEDVARLDQRNPITCPECGHCWRVGPNGPETVDV
jgi:ParB-like chromosome segregation protein Spo0J